MGQKLTKEQLENWRKALHVYLGPAVNLLSDEKIQAYKDQLQENIDKTEEKRKNSNY